MIKTVCLRNNIKSWDTTKSKVDVAFGQKNIIYGLNGSGKSSFTRILSENCSNIENIRIFGRDYIEKNIILKNDNIKGVKTDFSNKNVEIESKIESKREKIKKKEISIATSKDRKNESEEIVLEEINTIVKRRRAGNTKINNKPSNKTLSEIISLWKTDYDNAKNKFPNEDFTSATGKTDYSVELREANNIQESNGKNLNLLDFNQINSILNKNYADIDIPSNDIINWIEEGVHLHSNEPKRCAFCGSNTLSLTNVKHNLEKYRNNEKNKAELVLKNSLNILDEITENLSLISDIMTDEEVESSAEFIRFCQDTIQAKINDMSITNGLIDISLVTKYSTTINDAALAHNNNKNKNIKCIENKINRLSDLVKGAIGKEIVENDIIEKHLKDILLLEKEIDTQIKEKEALEDECKSLIAEKNNINDFKNYLNQVFVDLGLDFELVLSDVDDKSYTLVCREDHGNKLTTSDISEGEEHLLALIYFYYEMYEKPDEEKIRNELETLIIDDPICSLDDNNKFYIQELLKNLLKHNDIQIFILTHSWDSFCNLCYGRDRQYCLFEIQKDNSVSSIKNISNMAVLKPYRLLFNEVYYFSKKIYRT